MAIKAFSDQLEGTDSLTLRDDAQAIRNQHFGNRVFIRGVVEISNFCRENCGYCGMRRDNKGLHRFRLSADDLFQEITRSLPPLITDLNIQAGEDPVAVREIALPLLELLRKHTRLGLSVCLGTLRSQDYLALQAAGATYYVIKLETGDADHYAHVRAPGTLEERIAAIRELAEAGWWVSSGFVLGLPGQTREILDATVRSLEDLPIKGCSVSPFVPGEDTPFSHHPAESLVRVIDAVAALRTRMPTHIIPAVSAMQIAGQDGYAQALRAGANLATINLTPAAERANYQIYRRERPIMTVERVLREIEAAGCVPSSVGISEWLSR